MDQTIRNNLRAVVTDCRKTLETSIAGILEGKYGIHSNGRVEEETRMTHLSHDEQRFRSDLVAHLHHIEASGFSPKEAVTQLIREMAFTHLNRIVAFKLLEKRGHIRETVSRGVESNGFRRYLAEHSDEEGKFHAGDREGTYTRFLTWLGSTLSREVGVLFSPLDPANTIYPPLRILEEVIGQFNKEELAGIWEADETIGWVYQYFTPKELREEARSQSGAPRNSYEMAFRNQFFTPRYVVRFLSDNTLGRIWYEQRHGKTVLAETSSFMVRFRDEVFLGEGSVSEAIESFLSGKTDVLPPLYEFAHAVRSFDWTHDERQPKFEALLHGLQNGSISDLTEWTTQDLWDCLYSVARATRFNDCWEDWEPHLIRIGEEIRRRILAVRKPDATQEEILKGPVLVFPRKKKDPRDIAVMDPACGSGHFLLYCYDLFEQIYQEAWEDPTSPVFTGSEKTLRDEYPDKTAFLREVPRLIIQHNLHGIDIDLRAVQIASFALWLRAQRSFHDQGIPRGQRPPITRANIVCAERMPGEREMLEEFIRELKPPILGNLVKRVFDKMDLAGEAGSLLKIEEDIREAIAQAHQAWQTRPRDEQKTLFPTDKQARLAVEFDLHGISDARFWEEAEQRVVEALQNYAARVENGKGFSRRLFAEDAEQGFAFIELSRHSYDVVLMNPPFGSSSTPSKTYIDQTYPRTKNDVYAAFVERWAGKLRDRGRLGAITSRTGFFLTSFQKWREEILLKEVKPVVVADLGYGVLDAMVETAAYCLEAKE